MSLKWIIPFVLDAQLVKLFNLEYVFQKKYINIFRHLELEIASAIPASNDKNAIEVIQQGKG